VLTDIRALADQFLIAFPNINTCLLAKMTKVPSTGFAKMAFDLLELLRTDVCGPMSMRARGGFKYFITFTNNFSRYGYVYLMKHKSMLLENSKEMNEVEKQCGKKT